jgi:hypothetical protein
MEVADGWIRPEHREAWEEGLAITNVTNEELRRQIADNPGLIIDETEANTSLDQNELDRLEGEDLVRRITRAEVKGTVKLFTVPEFAKKRKRLIAEPLLNKLPGSHPKVTSSYCTADEIASLVGMGARLTDLPWMYGQIPLSTEAMTYYSFCKEGQWYCLKTVPTGARACPELAHALTSSMAKTAAEGREVMTSTYVDNIRFQGADEQTEMAMKRLFQIFVMASVTHEEEFPQHMTSYVFLGIQCTHSQGGGDHQVSLSMATKEKLFLMEVVSSGPDSVFTLRDVLSYTGLLVWCARVLGLIKASWYPFLKFLRRRSRGVLDDKIQWWAVARECFENIIRELLGSGAVEVGNIATTGLTIFTDACMSGWAVLILWPNKIEVYGERCVDIEVAAGSWKWIEHINVLETRAVLKAVELVPRQPQKTHCPIFLDNTSALGAVKKGYSKNYILNKVAGEIRTVALKKNYVLMFEYIHTLRNPADPFSRIRMSRGDEIHRGFSLIEGPQMTEESSPTSS